MDQVWASVMSNTDLLRSADLLTAASSKRFYPEMGTLFSAARNTILKQYDGRFEDPFLAWWKFMSGKSTRVTLSAMASMSKSEQMPSLSFFGFHSKEFKQNDGEEGEKRVKKRGKKFDFLSNDMYFILVLSASLFLLPLFASLFLFHPIRSDDCCCCS